MDLRQDKDLRDWFWGVLGNNPLRNGELWTLGRKKRRGVGKKCVWEDLKENLLPV